METKKVLAYSEVTLAVLFWGGSFVATKVALRDVTPLTVVWLRFGMGVVILWAAVLARRQLTLPAYRQGALPGRDDLAYFALLGFLGITFHQWLQSTGLQTAQATTTAWIVATTPIFMAILGWLVLHEKLRPVQVGGIMLAAAGVLLVVTRGDLAGLARGRVGTPGDLLVLVSSPNWAVFSALSRRGLQRFPATRMMAFVMSFGWLFTTLLFLPGPGLADVSKLTLPGWLGVTFLGVACSGLAYIFWYDALQALPVAQAGAFVYLEPFVTVVVAALVLAEPLLAASLAGGLAIILGVVMVQKR